jgi:2,3-bisphosphoglycerate-dependent phosphoglycerate mutase
MRGSTDKGQVTSPAICQEATAMQLLLIRHARPARIEGRAGGADPALDEVGREQAKHLAEYLASETIHAVYASPMRRAVETAAPLAAELGVEVSLEPDITEFDVAAETYIPAEELKAAGDMRWRAGATVDEWPADCEPLEVFHSRVVAGIDRIIARHPGQTVAVVCHGGVISRYGSAILGLPWEQIWFFYPLYTSVSRIAANRSGVRTIVSLNEVGHLRGTGLPTGALHLGP